MENFKFNEVKDGKTIRTVVITEQQAEALNKNKKSRGTEFVKDVVKPAVIEIDGVSYEIQVFKDAFNKLENVKNITANTGIAKTIERFEELEDAIQEEVINFLK